MLPTVASWFGPLQRQKCHVPMYCPCNSEFSSCLFGQGEKSILAFVPGSIIHFPLSLLLSPGTAPQCPREWAQELRVFHKESV